MQRSWILASWSHPLLGAASGEDQSNAETEADAQDTASSGKTGLLMEGTTDGGKLNETITIQAAGTPYVTATVSDWDIEGMKSGKLMGSVSQRLCAAWWRIRRP